MQAVRKTWQSIPFLRNISFSFDVIFKNSPAIRLVNPTNKMKRLGPGFLGFYLKQQLEKERGVEGCP
ncbi:hypothetical protein D3H55_19620 [Bacillus salacetis]|uniref:Uncharacterized protein n=1 Tax=Bacillus salacetis TaxID=2315464 RepID=A0A3A1QQR2_9BACI|nr:hypothetical protein D3H55_19620 [Bacillus salacetis]